ncbi:MAG: tol-pal system YbgF family protein [Phycisphaeraceae bacterium]
MICRVIVALVFACVLQLSVQAQVSSPQLGRIAAHYEAGEHGQAIAAAQKLVDAGKDVVGLADMLIKYGGELAEAKRFGDTARYYQLVSDAFPNHEQIESIHTDLLACYYYERELSVARQLANDNLNRYPKSPWVEYWRFLDAQIQYRLYQFDSAKTAYEKFLADYPDSQYARNAKADLGRIDPVMEVDEHGIVKTNSRLSKDARLKQAIGDLPGLIDEGYDQLLDRLGVDVRSNTQILYSFIDKGPKISGGLKATTRVIGIDNKPTTVVEFYTDAVVTDPQSYAVTAVHELKHAGFIGKMDAAYHDLPEWIREGLALWGTDDIDTRMHSVLGNAIASGKDPLSPLDGIEDPDHDYRDYMEDVLAFEWLASIDADNVRKFCRRLIAGEDYKSIWSDLAGMPYEQAMQSADAYCKQRVQAMLGEAYQSYLPLRAASDRAAQGGAQAAKAWSDSDARRSLQAWIDANGEHPAAPIARFTLARSLIVAGEHDAGRALLAVLLDPEQVQSSLMDDAQFWVGVSYNYEKNMEKSKEAFGILLRDYPNSSNAPQVRGKFQPAAPVTD